MISRIFAKILARTRKRGFTLIETLVAVMLLVAAVAGVLGVAARSLRLAAVAREQLIAFYLAQEPVEFVRFIRDSNRLRTPPRPWLNYLPECISANGSVRCTIDALEERYPPLGPTINTCAVVPCPVIKVRTTSGLYGYKSGAQWKNSKFTRTTTITTPVGGNADEARVDVTVSWQVGLVQRSVVIREHLFNW